MTYRAVPLNCSFRPFPFEDATVVARLVTCGATNRLAKIYIPLFRSRPTLLPIAVRARRVYET
eukprot:COSAG01_NODE_9954_length_2293_cov_2.113036_4_plen_63_part_00